MDENPKRCETIKPFAELCEMKFRVLLGSQLESLVITHKYLGLWPKGIPRASS